MLLHRRDIPRVDSTVTLLASHSRFYDVAALSRLSSSWCCNITRELLPILWCYSIDETFLELILYLYSRVTPDSIMLLHRRHIPRVDLYSRVIPDSMMLQHWVDIPRVDTVRLLASHSRFHHVAASTRHSSWLIVRYLHSRVIPDSLMLQHLDIPRVDSHVTLLASHTRFYDVAASSRVNNVEWIIVGWITSSE